MPLNTGNGEPFRGAWAQLPQRHRRVAELIVQGLGNQAIAESLDPPLRTHTVEQYVSEILAATNWESRAELIAMYYQHIA